MVSDTSKFIAPSNTLTKPVVHKGTLIRLKQHGRFGVRVEDTSAKAGDWATVTTWKGVTKQVTLVEELVRREGSVDFSLRRNW